ncbi:MAG: CHASE2 domain-containing protein [Myxococcota bacterium]
MATNPLPSATLHLVRKFGVAFFWAFVFGGILAPMTYYRLQRTELGDDPRWHAVVRLWLERLEWVTYDWRARELGAASEQVDDVVLVTVDEETVVNARESERPEWAMRPWPRELLGQLIDQALKEGASLVVVDESFADVSPHRYSPGRGESRKTDDELFAQYLEKNEGKVILGFEWSTRPRRLPERPLSPFLVKLAEADSSKATLPLVRDVLSRQVPAWVEDVSDGKRVLWVGAASEAKARELAAAFDVSGTPTIRSLTPADDAWEVNRDWLARRLADVKVDGLDPNALPHASALDVPVPSLLTTRAGLGAMSLTPDVDRVLRATPLFVAATERDGKRTVLASTALKAALQLAGDETPKLEAGRLTLGRFSVPVDAQGFLTLRFSHDEVGAGGRGTMKRSIPAWRLLVNRQDDEAARGVRHHDNELAGKVVVFSDERADAGRRMLTPVGSMSRAAITAQAIVDLLRGQGITRVPPALDLWITITFAFVGAVLALAWSSLVRRPGWLAWVVTIAVVSGSYALVARQLFVGQQRWVAMAAPLLACALTFLASLGYARTLEQSFREFVIRALGGAVRADVFRKVERDLALMAPERRELTVYFSDIEGFTAVAQDKEPREVVRVLREYLTEMTPVILDTAGHVDKYLGDGLMAFWGAPVELPGQAAVACEAALRLKAKFDARREAWEKACGRPLTMRAGIETGPTVVGEMGTSHRINYTVMGEPVATAFRLEALAKRYGAHILVGEAVVLAAGEDFLFRQVDLLRLGRAETPVKLFELVGRAADTPTEATWLIDFETGMKAWRSKRFADALAAFKRLAEARPDDMVVARYVRRCQHYVMRPPPDSWDGVYDGPDDE